MKLSLLLPATGACLVLGVAGLASATAQAGEISGTYTFEVLRNGEPVGEHAFSFSHNAGRVEIEETSAFEVMLAFIPVYTLTHQHHEIWQDGHLLQATSVTDKNGEKIDLTLEAEKGGLRRTINGKTDWLGPEVTPLAVWNQDILEGTKFVSVAEDKLIDATFEHVGSETLEIAGEPVPLEHYKLGGDEPRDVWYDPAGHVARVRLDRGSSVMEYVRNEPTIELPQQLACLASPTATC